MQLHGTRRDGNARGATALAAAFLLLAPARVDHAQHTPPQDADAPVEGTVDARAEVLAAEALRRMPVLGEEGARLVSRVIIEETDLVGLDPVLVMAMITVESRGFNQAVSRRGARGLMQVLPSTQVAMEERGGLPHGDPHDPVHNIRVGVRFYGRMFETFGDPDLALVAYHVGPTRLSSYIQAVGEVPAGLYAYARRVRREELRLRQSMGLEDGETLDAVLAD